MTELGARRSPATVAECFRLFSSILRAVVRDRLIGANPCEGVKFHLGGRRTPAGMS